MKRIILVLILIILISGCNEKVSKVTGDVISDLGMDIPEEIAVKEGPFNVTKIVDGDTIDLENYGRIRLSGINTPETGECYYQEAKDKLEELVLGKDVFVEKDRSDEGKYGRKLRYVYLDELMINKFLVENGYARVYDKYKDDTKRYNELKEAEKEALNLGVWVCKDPKQGCLYVGSKNSEKYHKVDCTYAKKISLKNLVCYKSEKEVEELEKCKGCF